MAKLSSSSAQVIVGALTLTGVLVVGWWQFVRKPEPTAHYYVVNVKEASTMQPIEHAHVTVAWQSANDLLPSGSDGAATFKVPASTGALHVHVYVQAPGYDPQDRDVTVPTEDANVLFTLERASRS